MVSGTGVPAFSGKSMGCTAAADRDIEAFVALLSAVPSRRTLFNPYALAQPGATVRAARLVCYLALMRRLQPGLLLVGEAIGYRGGAVSGIPFTSLDIAAHRPLLADCWDGVVADEASPRREATATIVWEAIGAGGGSAPLLWNIVPFHPHRPGEPQSNRPPRAAEIRAGQAILVQLLRLIPVRHVVAVGRQAERGLRGLGLAHTAVRHPSHGGKADFLIGVAPLLARYCKTE
jgi:uracil-DNA glycosylase